MCCLHPETDSHLKRETTKNAKAFHQNLTFQKGFLGSPVDQTKNGLESLGWSMGSKDALPRNQSLVDLDFQGWPFLRKNTLNCCFNMFLLTFCKASILLGTSGSTWNNSGWEKTWSFWKVFAPNKPPQSFRKENSEFPSGFFASPRRCGSRKNEL